jgi:RNA polymerase sigma-70 factor (ECF subfamily)
VPLEEQDRALWNRAQIQEGTQLVERALGMRSIGAYQLQAAIDAIHGEAQRPQETDWRQIAELYAELYRIAPTPVIALNHAVAVAMGEGLERGLGIIDELGAPGDLDGYYLFHAARADLLRRMRRNPEAKDGYQKALAHVTNPVERRFLAGRLREVSESA